MPEPTSYDMARGRALMTEAEKEHIRGERDSEQRKYESVSRVRARIEEELTTDVEIMKENHPELLQDLREVVCDDD